VSVAVQNIAA